MFSIDGTFDKSIKLNESHDELTHLVLKPHEKFTINIKCEQSIGKCPLQTEECMYTIYEYFIVEDINEIFVK